MSVRFYDATELDRSKPLLEQVLRLGSVDIRGPADPVPVDEDGTAARRNAAADNKQAARQLLSSARRDISSGDFDEAAEKLARARTLDVKWGLPSGRGRPSG